MTDDIITCDSMFYQYDEDNCTKNKKIVNLFDSYDIGKTIKDEALNIFKEIYNNEQIGHKGGIRKQLIFFCIFYAMYKNKIYKDPYLLCQHLNIDCNIKKAIKKFSWFIEDAEIIWINSYDLVSDYINCIRDTYPEVGRLEYFIKTGLDKIIKEDEQLDNVLQLYDPRIVAISYMFFISNKNGIKLPLPYLKEKFNINILNIKKIAKLFIQ